TTSHGPTVVLGSGIPLTDSATLSHGLNPTGTITFGLYSPLDNSSVPNYVEQVTVNGDGTYAGASYVPAAADGTGVFQWVAIYSGDANNPSVNSGMGNEPEAVVPPPTISTTAGPTVVLLSGHPLTDSALLGGLDGLTGSITFALYAPADTA